MRSADIEFATFGEEVDPQDVPSLVREGIEVWAYGYGDDAEFTTLQESDLWAFDDERADPERVASWGPFRADVRGARPEWFGDE